MPLYSKLMDSVNRAAKECGKMMCQTLLYIVNDYIKVLKLLSR